MNIEIVNRWSFSELVEKVRQVPLMQKIDGKDVFVYEDARISKKTFHPEEINLTSCYLLSKNSKVQRELREHLMGKYNVDPLHLDGALELRNDSGEEWVLTPPIIELIPKMVKYVPNGVDLPYDVPVRVQLPCVIEGLHRVSLARELDEPFDSLFISGILKDAPFYSHPNGWDRVKSFDEVPRSKEEKKMYVREDCYSLYRDFSIFNCGNPRYTSK
jgi:hypothetical protein